MAKGFFRELKHYRLLEIAKELETTIEETKRLVGVLKKYGTVKTVKASKPEYEELSNQDIVLTDVIDNNTDVEYVFDFIGVVMVEEHVFKCYPKYISSISEPVQQLKQVLKVIKKYNDKEQLVYLYNGEEDNRIFNRLAVSLHLLEDYFQYGIYNNQHEVIETNGEGEILWDKTINETFALIQNNQPYYIELQTVSAVDNEMDYIRRLHECVLSRCTEELKHTGILELFDIAEVELTTSQLEDFGDADYIMYRLEREIQTQFITRKQTLLKTIYTYIANERANQEDMSFSLYGTNSFNLVWEKVCSENFGNALDKKISSLPLGVAPEYMDRKDEKLRCIIDKPVWCRNNPIAIDKNADTLRPDIICIYPCNEQKDYCFGIFDAKYYQIDFQYYKNGWKVTGQPGVGDVTKQYLYQLAYDDFIARQGYRYVQNMFFCPKEESEPEYGYVSMEMFQNIGNRKLENISVVKLCAEEMYNIYLSGKAIPQEEILNYIPKIGKKEIVEQNFVKRMETYLRGIASLSQKVEKKFEMKNEKGRLVYPKQIKRELGAKVIYETICSVATEVLYGLEEDDKIYGNMVAEDIENSYQLYNQIADIALDIEKVIKGLSEPELRDETIINEVLQKCFRNRDDISFMGMGKSLSRLKEKMMELIREVYL